MRPSFQGVVWFAWGSVALLLAAALMLGLYREPDRIAGQQATGQSPPARPADAGSAPASASLTARGPRVHSPGPPSFDIVSVDQRGQAVIAGRALPGDRIRVL